MPFSLLYVNTLSNIFILSISFSPSGVITFVPAKKHPELPDELFSDEFSEESPEEPLS